MLIDLKNNYQTNSRASAGELNRIATLLRNMRGEGGTRVYIDRATGGAVIESAPGGASAGFNFSFRCTLGTREPVEPETDPVPEVRIAAGYKQIVGSAPVAVDAAKFDVGSGGSIYCTWTHTTDTTAGAWSDPFWAYGTPTTETDAVHVVVLATVTSAGVITHRHLGDVIVLDIVDRTACV
ncbi:MAG: hypothetical protein KBC05_14855 [Candidatus Hydrogenedentes bacterium]|nr:hypothetical protein [Candidatus Hydrogenedentota bacterium]